MSLDVVVRSSDAMWLLVLRHVTWCNAMSCDVRSCEELSSVVPCNGMECYELKTPLFSKVLLCTTKCCSRTTLYYKVLLQYYSVLQSTAPVLLCCTKYDSCTTQYSCTSHAPTSPNAAPATKSQCHDPSSSNVKRYLQCTKQHKSSSNVTKCCACQEKKLSCSILFKHETLFTMREAAQVILQPHHQSSSSMKRYLQCAKQHKSSSNITECCSCHWKSMSWLILFGHEMLVTIRRATGVNLQSHQMLRLPRKVALMSNPLQTWNATYNAQSSTSHSPTSPNAAPAKKRALMINPLWAGNAIHNARSSTSHPRTSPNAAPATKSECHDYSSSHMKCYLQCGEQQMSMSKVTEYCACHVKWSSKIGANFDENWCNVISIKRPIRPWSDHKNANRNPPRHRGYFSRLPGADSIKKYNISRSGYHSKFHHMLRLPRKVTQELHHMLRMPRKATRELHQMLHLPRKVTQELHQILHLPRKVNFVTLINKCILETQIFSSIPFKKFWFVAFCSFGEPLWLLVVFSFPNSVLECSIDLKRFCSFW